MKYLYSLIVLVILAGCSPITGGDPASLEAAAQAMRQRTAEARAEDVRISDATKQAAQIVAQERQSAERATAAALAAQSAQATSQVAATAQSLDNEAQALALQATKNALYLQATAQQATAQTIELQSSQARINMSISANATSTAIGIDTRARQRQADAAINRTTFFYTIVFMAFSVLCFGGLALFGWWGWRLTDEHIARKQIEAKALDLEMELRQDRIKQLPAQTQQPAPKHDEHTLQVLEFTRKAARVAGWTSNQVPRWQSPDGSAWIGAASWTASVSELKLRGWVETSPQGTYLVGGATLRDLLIGLEVGIDPPSPLVEGVVISV